MDAIDLKSVVEDVLDQMVSDEYFKDEELIPWLIDIVGDTATDLTIGLNAADMDKVLNAVTTRMQELLKEAHYAARGK